MTLLSLRCVGIQSSVLQISMQITVRSASCTRDKNRIYQITFRNHRQKKGRKKHLKKSFQRRRRRRVTSSSSSLSPRDRTQKPTEKLLEKKNADKILPQAIKHFYKSFSLLTTPENPQTKSRALSKDFLCYLQGLFFPFYIDQFTATNP